MSSRALTLATVMLLIGCLAADQAQAQATNLEAGKSPSQIFAGTCNACHKSPRGLLKTVPAGSLPTFLRQHYTTSSEMAGVLASFLVSNGATDTRYTGGQPKGTKEGAKEGTKDVAREAKQEAQPASPPPAQLDRFGRRQRPAPAQEAAKPETEQQQAAKPDADGPGPQVDPVPPGHNRRLARPGQAPESAKPGAEGQPPVQADSDRGPDGRKLSAKQRLSKRGKPAVEEPPKADEPVGSEPKSETASKDEGKPPTDTGPGSAKSETAKVEPAKEAGKGAEPLTTRPDPVPPVTPAPPSTSASAMSKPEPLAAPSEPAAQPPPPTVTASTPPLPPVAPAGPPAPPISQ